MPASIEIFNKANCLSDKAIPGETDRVQLGTTQKARWDSRMMQQIGLEHVDRRNYCAKAPRIAAAMRRLSRHEAPA